jgi:hypothetical protein
MADPADLLENKRIQVRAPFEPHTRLASLNVHNPVPQLVHGLSNVAEAMRQCATLAEQYAKVPKTRSVTRPLPSHNTPLALHRLS